MKNEDIDEDEDELGWGGNTCTVISFSSSRRHGGYRGEQR